MRGRPHGWELPSSKMLHPRVQASFSGPARGPDQDRWPLYHRKAQKLSARATRGATRAGARTLGRLLLPRFLPAWSFAPGRSWVCVKAASSPDAMAEYAWVRSGGSGILYSASMAPRVYVGDSSLLPMLLASCMLLYTQWLLSASPSVPGPFAGCCHFSGTLLLFP